MTYVTNDTSVIPMQEIVTVGIQKRTTLNILLSSLLATKKVANRKIAVIHGWHQRGLPSVPQRSGLLQLFSGTTV